MRPWVLAARPATLWAAVVPVLVGGALAERDGAFRILPFLAALAAAVLIQVGVNYANDAADARRGADTDARVGPARAVSGGLVSETAMWRATALAFAAAVPLGVYLAIHAGGVVIAIGVAAILAAIGYTSGPAYGYRGLGEVFVFVFFGLVATVGSRYVHDRSAPEEAWLLAIPIGMLVTAILVVNNLRDAETDAAAGKRTLAVRLGHELTRALFGTLVVTAFAVIGLFAALGMVPAWSALALLALPGGLWVTREVAVATDPARLIRALVATAQVHAAAGLLMAGGIALA